MEEKNCRYTGARLDMSLLLTGFFREVFDVSKSTLFKWTLELYSMNNGRIAWIRKRVAEWVEVINQKSGATLVEHEFKGRRFQVGEHKLWEVEFEFVIPGALNLAALHPAMAKHFSGFFKKFLAEEIFRRFPLSFKDLRPYEIPFAAGITDMYVLKPDKESGDGFDRAQKVLFGSEFGLWLEKILKENYSATLKSIKYMGDRRLCRRKSLILLKWQKDVIEEERYGLAKEIKEKLKAMGATYKIPVAGGKYYDYCFYEVNCR